MEERLISPTMMAQAPDNSESPVLASVLTVNADSRRALLGLDGSETRPHTDFPHTDCGSRYDTVACTSRYSALITVRLASPRLFLVQCWVRSSARAL